MTDGAVTVAIAIIAAVPTTIAAIGAVLAIYIKRDVNTLDKTVTALTETVKQEAKGTQRVVQSCCRHPDDLPPRASSSAVDGRRAP